MTAEQDRSADGPIVTPTPENYIGGEWVAPTGEQSQTVIDPGTGEELNRVGFSGSTDVEEAVSAAREAFDTWRRTSPVDRIQPLFDLKAELEDRSERIARAIVRENGKTVDEARGEIKRGIENVEVATGCPNMLREGSGTVAGVSAGVDESALRRPLGVFAAVTPFNFPAMIPLWFLPYAVATGNTFVLKPSERVPSSAKLIFEAIDAVDFPDGVVNLLNGSADTVTSLLEHDDVEGVSFVGSTPIAEKVYARAAEHGKRVQAQGGAKNYAVVMPSAELADTVPNLVGSVYGNAGQRCLANDVVVGVGDAYAELRSTLVDAVEDLTVGYGLDDGVDVGPVITGESRDRIERMVEAAIEEGAKVVVDGRDFEHPEYPDGTFVGPILLEDVTSKMEIANQELFGPVLCLARADDLDAAIEMVNGTPYGNAASIYTERGGEARTFDRMVEVGNVGVNVGVCAPMAFFHFGGRKQSFFGDLHAQGEDAIGFYTDKTVTIERWYR